MICWSRVQLTISWWREMSEWFPWVQKYMNNKSEKKNIFVHKHTYHTSFSLLSCLNVFFHSHTHTHVFSASLCPTSALARHLISLVTSATRSDFQEKPLETWGWTSSEAARQRRLFTAASGPSTPPHRLRLEANTVSLVQKTHRNVRLCQDSLI